MQKPLQILFLLLIGFPQLTISQNYPTGGRAIALSNAFVSISDTWSTSHNQAGLANLKTFSAGIFHESRFFVDELTLTAGTFSAPIKTGTFALSFYQFGKGTFKEQKAGLAFAKQLSKNLSAGIQLDYFSKQFPENEKAFGFATFECGLIFLASKQITLGIHAFNPVKNGIKTLYDKDKSPFIYRAGGHYQFSDLALISVEIQKSSHQTSIIKSGLEFIPHKNLAIRLGVAGKPAQLSSGIGYKHKNICTDIAFSYHQNLGLTPSVSLQFEIK